MFGVELFNFNLVLLVLELFLFFWYDSNPIRTCINEEIKTSDQIPLKSNFRHGWQRRLSIKTFKKEIFSRRNNVESIFSVIKRKCSGINKNKSTRLQNKETRLKTFRS